MSGRAWLAASMSVLLLAGCSNGKGERDHPLAPSSSAHSDGSSREAGLQLEARARAYSDAYLTGEADTAYAILSNRCRRRLDQAQFESITEAAADVYGKALRFQSFTAEVNGDLARLTYTYRVPAINQVYEPWSLEDGQWHNDDC